MSATCDAKAVPAIGFFERYLTAWVAACILIGVALGQLFPALFQTIGAMEVAKVNLPVRGAYVANPGYLLGAALLSLRGGYNWRKGEDDTQQSVSLALNLDF